MAAVVSLVTLLVAASGLWALLSSEPIVPVALEWVRSLGDSALSLLLVISLAAVVGWMVWIQYQIFRAVSVPEIEDELPEGVVWGEGWLSANADTTLDLTEPIAATAQSVRFKAVQGRRVIVDDKEGEVDQRGQRFRLPFKVAETRRLKDGYLVVQATIITGEGNQTVTQRVAIKTHGPLKRQ